MKEELKSLILEFRDKISIVEDLKTLENLRIEFSGKKSKLANILKGMGKLDEKQRPIIGKFANELRDEIAEKIKEKTLYIEKKIIEQKEYKEKIDLTKPSVLKEFGGVHPTTIITKALINIFLRMGFSLKYSPEIDTVYNNFDGLNVSKEHPSRDKSDTFYIDDKYLLRTHTSPMQVRELNKNKPPLKLITVGRCFRNDEFDATHSPMFYQLEGLVVGEKISMANLKSTLERFIHELFGEETKSVFRPHNFPFTEPSAEVDISCFKCKQKGCKFCSYTGFIEILGCGMTHPNVLEMAGIDSEKYTGFAFGMGIDRITMMKYEIEDIRTLYENDKEFVKQFRR